MKYEYQVVRPVTPGEAKAALQEYGADGWKLVAVDDSTLYFERALAEQPPAPLVPQLPPPVTGKKKPL